jgi:uncharacterized membrane protein
MEYLVISLFYRIILNLNFHSYYKSIIQNFACWIQSPAVVVFQIIVGISTNIAKIAQCLCIQAARETAIIFNLEKIA